MLDKSEWDVRLARHQRFWSGKTEGEGAYVAVTAPQAVMSLPPVAPEIKWLDTDYRVNALEAEMENTFYGGDALPHILADIGPGILPALLGRPFRLADNTIWFDIEPLETEHEIANLSLQTNGFFHGKLIELTSRLCERGQGRYLTGIADMGGGLDILAALYQRENLLEDFVLDPHRITRLLRLVNGWWKEAVMEHERAIRKTQDRIISWVPIANKNSYYPLLSEFSAMISPDSFKQVTLPSLCDDARIFDQVVSIVDGENYIRHLPYIFEIEHLHAIEWIPSVKYMSSGIAQKNFAGEESIAACRTIQEHAKLILDGIPPEQVSVVMDQISHDGVFLNVQCKNVHDAGEFLAFAQKYIKGKP